MNKFSLIMPFTDNSSERRKEIAAWVVARHLDTWTVDEMELIIGIDDGVPFNRSLARNGALEHATCDVVVIADIDTVIDKRAVERGVEMVQSGTPWVIPYEVYQYYSLTKEYTDTLLANPDHNVPIERPVWEFKLLSWAGVLIARTDDVRMVGGYDERFVGWGHEDVAFRIVMDHHVGHHERVRFGQVFHLWHERDNANFNIPDEKANRELFDREYRQKYNWVDERTSR